MDLRSNLLLDADFMGKYLRMTKGTRREINRVYVICALESNYYISAEHLFRTIDLCGPLIPSDE